MADERKTALVIGGGPAGIEAALQIGKGGFRCVLVEREETLGGTLKRLHSSFPRWEDPQDLLNPRIEVLKRTTVESAKSIEGGFEVALTEPGGRESRRMAAGAVVLATGFELMDASIYGEYGYGIYPNVLNSLEFEERLREWSRGSGDAPRAVALIQCVGSRDRSRGFPYCSRICCMYSAKQAGLVKDLFPEAKVYVFYMDTRAVGKGHEEFLRGVIEGKHVRYVRGRASKVLPESGRLLVRAEDTLMGIPVEVAVDVVVLAAAVVPHTESVALAKMFGAKVDEYGFLEPEAFHPGKVSERVFFAGGCGFAVDSEGALAQGAAAAAGVIALLNGEKR